MWGTAGPAGCVNRVKDLLTIPALEAIAGLRHAFTTRQRGLGERNGGMRLPDDWDAVARSIGIAADRVVTVHQVHGDDIVVVKEQNFRDVRTRQVWQA